MGGALTADGSSPMGSRVDLHAHTTASDGVLSPAELVALARGRGLAALGVTDHDSTEGLAAALAAADAAVTVVPGVELSTDVPGGEIHVLGYFVDPRSPVLQGKLEMLREGRLRRGHRMVERLNAAGVPIRIERVLEIAGDGAVGRPHVARALVEAGYAESIDDAFIRWLVPGRPGYVERQRFTPVEAVGTILEAGGVPVLAHPLHGLDAGEDSRAADAARTFDAAEVERRVAELVAAGLGGLETYYAGYDAAAVAYLERLAAQYGLIRTGGSDFHGPGRAELGSTPMPDDVQAEVVEWLRRAAGSSAPG